MTGAKRLRVTPDGDLLCPDCGGVITRTAPNRPYAITATPGEVTVSSPDGSNTVVHRCPWLVRWRLWIAQVRR